MELFQNNLNKSDNILSLLQECAVEEINIYNQAHIEMDCPFLTTNKLPVQTKHEIPLYFELKGDFNGVAICYLDTYQKELSVDQASFFQSLYVESMNILLGKMLTEIDKKKHYEITCSSPYISKTQTMMNIFNDNKTQIYHANYKLITNLHEYDCRVIFNFL
ncbi:MAG: hypothetical protein QF441_12235 [Bacteriovoracaceae bacterium]|jgi:hypothetical protein|nr:hypothetical protein [Halobacteriovoraceae bacterium]MDP7321374.1 hypothetical protein [Bacteriovoracaceae bacterium]|tara:strand:+ start:654 stop:1139 length:486 start_codon:yes stop_codon:yes gene_type:complete